MKSINPQTRSEPLPDNAPHILVVDDDQKIRALLGRFLSSNGFRVTEASDAAAARSYMRGLGVRSRTARCHDARRIRH